MEVKLCLFDRSNSRPHWPEIEASLPPRINSRELFLTNEYEFMAPDSIIPTSRLLRMEAESALSLPLFSCQPEQ